MNKFILPLVGFILLVGLLAFGLRLDPSKVPSPLIGLPAPAFKLPLLHDADRHFAPEEMLGKVWLLNVWASWCPSCRQEHPVLAEFAKTPHAVPIIGLNWKDKREDGLRWLAHFGDPYLLVAYDPDGRVGINYGVYGAPETYLIDKQGIIRFKQIGPITPTVLEQKILPLIKEFNR